jgi:DNA-binding beta-propeller fold protein YncE
MKRASATVVLVACAVVVCATSCRKKEEAARVPAPAAGKDYIYAAVNNALQIIDGTTDTVIKTIPYNDYVIRGNFSPDGKRYYANAFHSIYVFDTARQELVDTYTFSTETSKVTVGGMAASEDGTQLYLVCTIVKKKQNVPKLNLLPPQLIVLDTRTKNIVKNYELSDYMINTVLTLRNDPDHLILIGYDVHMFDLKTGTAKLIETLFNPRKGEKVRNCLPAQTCSSPGDHGIVVYGYYAGEGIDVSSGYMMIDRTNGTVKMLPGKDIWMNYSAVLSPDKKYIYAVMDELVKIDAETGKTVGFVQTETGTCYGVATSSDGKKVYVGLAGPDVSVYDAETLRLIKVIDLEADGGYTLQRITM